MFTVKILAYIPICLLHEYLYGIMGCKSLGWEAVFGWLLSCLFFRLFGWRNRFCCPINLCNIWISLLRMLGKLWRTLALRFVCHITTRAQGKEAWEGKGEEENLCLHPFTSEKQRNNEETKENSIKEGWLGECNIYLFGHIFCILTLFLKNAQV